MDIKFIDLFSGIGGFRLGFERAANALGFSPICVYTAEIKKPALDTYSANFELVSPNDITLAAIGDIPEFDVLLAGFPCQAFSSAGKRGGFLDTRGTLFFEIERILRDKMPAGFILENVEGLVRHDTLNSSSPIGNTLQTILSSLQDLGYRVTWKVLDSSEFGLAQARKRIFIVGNRKNGINLDDFASSAANLGSILETGHPSLKSKTIDLLLSHYSIGDLPGMSLKDKRGGKNNIHSWDIGLKGEVSHEQKDLLNQILKARRNKKWGVSKGISWMDGMPLSLEEIRTFFHSPNLQELLIDLEKKGYLVFEHPKDLIDVMVDGVIKKVRKPRADIPKGFNIVAGKLSFEVSKFLDPEGVAPTLVATDVEKMMVANHDGLRSLTEREMLRLFGFPEGFQLVTKNFRESCDLMGNSIAVNVVAAVSERMLTETFS